MPRTAQKACDFPSNPRANEADLFLLELEILIRARSGSKVRSLSERQKQLHRLHVTAFRRAMRRIRSAARSLA